MWSILLFIASPALAAPQNVRLCGEYALLYDDADYSVGDDYFNTAGTFYEPAKGVWALVRDNTTGSTVFSNYLYDSGPDDGCTPMLGLDSARTYTISFKTKVGTTGLNTIAVMDDDATPAVFVYIANSMFVPNASLSPVKFAMPGIAEWRMLAAAGYALWNEPGTTTMHHYTAFKQDCLQADGSHYGYCCHDSGNVYLGTTGARKYIITHELGHCLAKAHNDGSGANTSYGDDEDGDNCDDIMEEDLPGCANQVACGFTSGMSDATASGHQMNSREYQSAAIWEGWAHFYAAQTWNDPSSSECGYGYYKGRVNWDGDIFTDPSEQSWNLVVDCEDGTLGTPAAAYLETYCGASPTNRGVEYDWLRTFWDLRTDHSISFDLLVGALAASNPDAWNAEDTGPSANFPFARMQMGADAKGFLGTFNTCAMDNGVDH